VKISQKTKCQRKHSLINFKRYSELISCFLVAEQNNEILMKNHQSHPISSKPFLEVNGTFVQKTRKNQGYRYGKNKWKRRRENPCAGSKHRNIHMKIRLPIENPCAACSQVKLITKPSPSNVVIESLSFLKIIQGDICEPIHPPCRPFRYFMVLIDASSKWSHVCLLSS
jgi:hypothetical protein